MNKGFCPVYLEKTDNKYAIRDGNGKMLIECGNLYNASLLLRYLRGKSMTREECNVCTNLLLKNDVENMGGEDLAEQE